MSYLLFGWDSIGADKGSSGMVRAVSETLPDRDLCKKALPPTAETQTQVFVYFRP